MPLSLLLALRYLSFRAKESTIAFMIRMCFLGIFIGTCSLMVTLIIMNGFEKTISEKMQGINADIIMTPNSGKVDDAQLKEFLQTTFPGAIKAMSGSSVKQVILDDKEHNSVVFIKGVTPADEAAVCTIGSKVIAPRIDTEPLTTLLKENHIIIGHKLAEEYNLTVGDEIHLLVPEPNSTSSIRLGKRKVVIAGIFNVGLEEFDHNFAYADINFFNEIFKVDNGVDALALTLAEDHELQIQKSCNIFQRCFWHNLRIRIARKMPFSDRDEYQRLIKKLKKELPDFSISSWKDLHPALVSSLKLEKYVMFFILALITLVASMNMISLLFMQIQHKRRDIAILKSMGMPQYDIKRIFLTLGMTITVSAATLGLMAASVIGYLLENYPFLQLPDVYYVSHLPARMELELFIVVALAVLLLGFLATWIPAKRAEYINITQVLRQEQ